METLRACIVKGTGEWRHRVPGQSFTAQVRSLDLSSMAC